jgi:hypothetical protein
MLRLNYLLYIILSSQNYIRFCLFAHKINYYKLTIAAYLTLYCAITLVRMIYQVWNILVSFIQTTLVLRAKEQVSLIYVKFLKNNGTLY